MNPAESYIDVSKKKKKLNCFEHKKIKTFLKSVWKSAVDLQIIYNKKEKTYIKMLCIKKEKRKREIVFPVNIII